jgi:hypothetical protein
LNPFEAVTDPPGVVSTTFTAPNVFPGVTTVTCVELTLVTDVPLVPPKVIALVALKLVPIIVRVVPPAVEPVFGEIEVIVGIDRDAVVFDVEVP